MATGTGQKWDIEKLSANHDLTGFDCGEPSLNNYLLKYAMQNQANNIGNTFVAVQPGTNRVEGYYTVSASSVQTDKLSAADKKGLPKYPVPCVHLGRLAVRNESKGQGLGEILLMHALRKGKVAGEAVAIRAMEVIALSAHAKAFYLKYGFREFLDDQAHLYLPLKEIPNVPN